MINYAGEEIKHEGCPGCAYGKHDFSLPCGMAYENERFTLSQDWELPIPGFMVLSPKKHIEKLEDFLKEERDEMFDIVNKTIKILRKNSICDRFEIILEEKENRHIHVWIMPRYNWMKEICDDIIDNIGLIFDYAKNNLRSKEVNKEIKRVTQIIKGEF